MAAIESPIQSPCVKVCVMDADSGLCRGCGRRIDEIATWSRMSAAERARVMAQLPGRMKATTASRAAGTVG
jgi:uncharacterized protein